MSGRARTQTQVGLTLKSMSFATTGSLGAPLARTKERRKPAGNKAKYCSRRAGGRRRRRRCLNLNIWEIQGTLFSFVWWISHSRWIWSVYPRSWNVLSLAGILTWIAHRTTPACAGTKRTWVYCLEHRLVKAEVKCPHLVQCLRGQWTGNGTDDQAQAWDEHGKVQACPLTSRRTQQRKRGWCLE